MRDAFVSTTTELLDNDPRTAVVLADISADLFRPAAKAHPDRVLNVGIREQLMLGVAGGLALTGLRPYVHSYAPFLLDARTSRSSSTSTTRASERCWSASAPRTTARTTGGPTCHPATSR